MRKIRILIIATDYMGWQIAGAIQTKQRPCWWYPLSKVQRMSAEELNSFDVIIIARKTDNAHKYEFPQIIRDIIEKTGRPGRFVLYAYGADISESLLPGIRSISYWVSDIQTKTLRDAVTVLMGAEFGESKKEDG